MMKNGGMNNNQDEVSVTRKSINRRRELVQRYTEILDLLELLEMYYGETYKISLEDLNSVFDDSWTKTKVLKYLKFLAGFNVISMQKDERDHFILDIDIVAMVFYAQNLDKIHDFRTARNDKDKLEIINRIFKHEEPRHCPNCCEERQPIDE